MADGMHCNAHRQLPKGVRCGSINETARTGQLTTFIPIGANDSFNFAIIYRKPLARLPLDARCEITNYICY